MQEENWLMKELKTIDKALLTYAHWIDNIDMYLGPARSTLSVSGSDLLEGIGFGIKVLDYGMMKGPFVAAYLARTKDFSALADWIPKELLAVSLPYGGLIEIMRRYEKMAKKHYGIK